MTTPNTGGEEDRLVISLDFGTTYSGVAYAFHIPGKKPNVEAIVDWPGLEGFRQPKVPTLVSYDKNDPSKFRWGGQVDWRDESVHGVKLLLDPDQRQPTYLPVSSFKKDRRALPKDPVDVAADFIRSIYEHAISVIVSSAVRDYFELCQKEFVLSVPAVWSDKAKDLTMMAARRAGFYPVNLIKEPEAAALYTLSTYDHSIKAGDAFVVCDAGGGTVDLITYEIKSIKPLELAELVPGSGGMSGSLGLNKRFEEAVRTVVGDEQFVLLKKCVGWSKALNEFDKVIKTSFNGDVTDLHYVSFPKAELEDDPAERLMSNCWEMTGDVLQDIFNPIIEDILRLVEAQVKEACYKRAGQALKGIFLVGGFGSSRYLKDRLSQVYAPQDIQVIQPPDAWGAIVKGGVLDRFPDQATARVISTQAVRHYGVTAWYNYDAAIDVGRPTKFYPDQGKDKVEKTQWYISMGQDLIRDETIKFPFKRTLQENYTPCQLIFKDTLYFSEARVAPTYPGPALKSCCSILSDLRGINKSQLVRHTGVDGLIYYDVRYNLVIATAAANLKFSLEFDGVEIGSVKATYV
ncbi:hypothetical protein diail_5689 [Diaporthe ilicicola]|nr:hypothetical protein diail_5689 [Diaporthe ilicicola]